LRKTWCYKFDKCDDNEDYKPDNENDNVVQQVAEPYKDDIAESENEVNMNTIHDKIANTLVTGG
jgi:hypothetical protein